MSKLFNKIVLLAEDNKVNRITASGIEVSCYERNLNDDVHMNFSYAPGQNGHFGQSIHVWKGNRLLYSGARARDYFNENSSEPGWEKAIESLVRTTILDKILG